jgi:hypothetical protein
MSIILYLWIPTSILFQAVKKWLVHDPGPLPGPCRGGRPSGLGDGHQQKAGAAEGTTIRSMCLGYAQWEISRIQQMEVR